MTEPTTRDFSKCIIDAIKPFGIAGKTAVYSHSWSRTTLQPDGTFLVETSDGDSYILIDDDED